MHLYRCIPTYCNAYARAGKQMGEARTPDIKWDIRKQRGAVSVRVRMLRVAAALPDAVRQALHSLRCLSIEWATRWDR